MTLLKKTDNGTIGAYRCWKNDAEGRQSDDGIAVGVVRKGSGQEPSRIESVARLVCENGKIRLVVSSETARRLNVDVRID